MSVSQIGIIAVNDKVRMGRPPVDTEAITLRLPRELIQNIDDLRRMEADVPTRPEMVRRVLSAYFREQEREDV